MEGAAEKSRHQKALVWWGAMMPNAKKPPTFEEFVGLSRRSSSEKVVCIKAWRELTESLRRGAGRKKGA